MIVIVTGGRHYSNAKQVVKVLNRLSPTMIVQGGATGADELALKYAIKKGIEWWTFPADWKKHGKAAGPIRNGVMLDEYPKALVVAFPGGDGTENCIRQALQREMVVLRVEE